eukprot:Nitzschia sp. Nitz4//scaffold341_size29662//18055//19932//NITZ4_008040-RA/size29662-exonerate_est2genome-gene-0.12-mRNA-1//1//CDS//3329548552//2409//frame0
MGAKQKALILPGFLFVVASVIFLGESVNAQYDPCVGVVTNPIVRKGKRFFDSITGEYFPIKGIAYYPRPNNGTLSLSNSVDFFTSEYAHVWGPDIQNLQALGVNTIRIYGVDPSVNHDRFMCTLQQAGIYVVVGLLAECFECGIGADEAPSCYPTSLKTRGQWIINEFTKYRNTLLFSAGNEVTLYARDRQVELNAPCQKKFLRDMREYTSRCHSTPHSILSRQVPIGLVGWDKARELQATYFSCRTVADDEFESTEWYGINVYLHCDTAAASVDDLHGWIQLRDDFKDFNLEVPVVIAEFGCRERFPTIGDFEAQRTWLQVDALYSEGYVEQFAGGMVFEYSAEKIVVDQSDQNKSWPYYQFMKLQYGVGYYSPVECDHRDVHCQYNRYPEFDLLSAKFHSIDVSFAPDMENFDSDLGEMPTCPDGIPLLSDFEWPSDEFEGLPCYTVPTPSPTHPPTSTPTVAPVTPGPTFLPTPFPTPGPTPTTIPTTIPTTFPTTFPTTAPTSFPTDQPTPLRPPAGHYSLTTDPTHTITASPTKSPTFAPTHILSTIDAPSLFGGPAPSSPSLHPTNAPTETPTVSPVAVTPSPVLVSGIQGSTESSSFIAVPNVISLLVQFVGLYILVK